ncbi:MAG: ABC transporter permease [Firmicutes bacterium]|nr:ABC transporter permease [Bacillota bacterium]
MWKEHLVAKLKQHLGKGGVTPEHAHYLAQIRLGKLAVWATQLTLLIALILFWEVGANMRLIDPFITSQPSSIYHTFLRMAKDSSIFLHTGITVLETTLSFIIGTIAGSLIAVFLWWSDFFSRVLDPYIVILNSTPKIALGPLFIVFLGDGMKSIITMALTISIIVTIVMVYTGFREVDPNKIKLIRTFGANKLQILQKVVLPASVPTMMAALKVNVGMSFVGVIVGEFLVARAGLGYLIVYGQQVFQLHLAMTSVVVLIITAAVLYQLVACLENRFLRWKE